MHDLYSRNLSGVCLSKQFKNIFGHFIFWQSTISLILTYKTAKTQNTTVYNNSYLLFYQKEAAANFLRGNL